MCERCEIIIREKKKRISWDIKRIALEEIVVNEVRGGGRGSTGR